MSGAIGSASSTIATNMLFGTGEISTQNYIDNGKDMPVNGSGGIAYLFGQGVSWGRTAWVNKNTNNNLYTDYIHEGTHWGQQQIHGFGRFYGTTVNNYIKSFIDNGSTLPLYNLPGADSYMRGNYEDIATQFELGILKIKW